MKTYCLLLLFNYAFAAGVSVDSTKCGVFLDAVDTGDLATIRDLLDEDPALVSIQNHRTKASHGSPLRLAILQGHSNIVEFLLSKGADPNERYVTGMGPLHEAAKKGNTDSVKVLVKYGADVNSRKKGFIHPPLCFATSRKVTEALIATGGVSPPSPA